MNPVLTAQALWSLWVQEQGISKQAKAFPFFVKVQTLLSAREMNPVLDALFDMSDDLQPGNLLFPLVAQVQRMAQWHVQHDKGVSFHTQLVAIPLGGPTSADADCKALWDGVVHYLQQRFRGRTRKRGRPDLGLTVSHLPILVAPEACAMLTVDDLLALTQEMAKGAAPAMAVKLMEAHMQWERAHPDEIKETSQRMAIAVLTHNADQFPANEGLDNWLTDIDPADWLWQRHMDRKAHWAFPPQSLTEAMMDMLWKRVEQHVVQACQAVDMSLTPEDIRWLEVSDHDDESVDLIPGARGQALPTLTLPSNWFSLIGPEAIDDLMHMWDPEDQREPDEPVSGMADNVTFLDARRWR